MFSVDNFLKKEFVQFNAFLINKQHFLKRPWQEAMEDIGEMNKQVSLWHTPLNNWYFLQNIYAYKRYEKYQHCSQRYKGQGVVKKRICVI